MLCSTHLYCLVQRKTQYNTSYYLCQLVLSGPSVVTGQPSELQEARNGCGEIATDSPSEPKLLFANHFRPEPPPANGQGEIGEEVGPAIQLGAHLCCQVQPSSEQAIGEVCEQ